VCWSALDLVSAYLAQCAVDGRPGGSFWVADSAKVCFGITLTPFCALINARLVGTVLSWGSLRIDIVAGDATSSPLASLAVIPIPFAPNWIVSVAHAPHSEGIHLGALLS
jgi:hypothetical protein